MTDKIEIIEQYREELAASMAKMFNSWEELWFGGFTRGVPYTAERVHKWLGRLKALAILTALEQGEPVGFLSLLSHWRDPEAAYIGLLGVSPHVVGKGVGKRLLLHSNAIAAQRGYGRIDLYTWAGNLSAVPLYKKAGFMWNPETEGTYFQSYIPAILSHPLCVPFFTAHPDWYSLLKRELTQAPDEMKEAGMDVFTYHFVAGEDLLRVTVDIYARGITAVERVLGGERLRLKAGVAEHLTLCSLPATYSLEVENGTSKDLALSVSLPGFSGLQFDGEPAPVLRVSAGRSAGLTVPFHLQPTAPLYRKRLKCPALTATLQDGLQNYTLTTGLKIKPAAEVHTQFGECRLIPGGTTALPVTITSNVSAALRGKLHFDCADLPVTVSPREGELEIEPEGLAGAVVEIVADDNIVPGTYDLWAWLELSIGEYTHLTTRRFRIPLFCVPEGAVAVGEDDRKRALLVVGADYTARLMREGGEVEIAVLGPPSSELGLETEIGPPFGMDSFSMAERDVSIEHSSLASTVVLTAVHPERPLRVTTRLIFPHNSPLIRQETWVTNLGQDKHELQLRLEGYSWSNLTTGRAVIPLASGLVLNPLASDLSNYPSLSDCPKAFAESWIAMEDKAGASGQVWDPLHLEGIQIDGGRIDRLVYRPVTLDPGEERRLSQIWHLTRTTNWQAVRRVWQEKIARRISLPNESAALPDPLPLLRIVPPPIIIPHRQSITSECAFHYAATAPLSGPLCVQPPQGWSAVLKGKEASETDAKVMLEKITNENLPCLSLALTPTEIIPDCFAVLTGHMRWETPVETRQPFSVVLLGTSHDRVEVKNERQEGHTVFQVTNGLLEFAVSADYGGCLFSLKNARGTELLSSAFPNPRPKEYVQNYFGGVQPIIGGAEEDILQAKTNREHMVASICQRGDIWKGIEITWQSKVQRDCRGMQFALRYLTAPGSPLILIDWETYNPTTAPLKLVSLLAIDAALASGAATSILQARWGGVITDIRPSPTFMEFTPDTNFAWLRRESGEEVTSEGIALLAAGAGAKTEVILLSASCFLLGSEPQLWLKPGEKRNLRYCIFANPEDSTVLERLQPLLKHL